MFKFCWSTNKTFINGVDKTIENSFALIRGAGNYLIYCTFTGNENYTASNSSQVTYIINKTDSLVHTYLNNQRSSILIYPGDEVEINSTKLIGEGLIKLYKNNILIDSGDNFLSNLSLFTSAGDYNITTIYEETENYTGSSETWYVSVDPNVSVNIISPLNMEYAVNSIDFIISSNKTLDSCRFSIDDWQTNYSMNKVNSSYFEYTLDSLNNSDYISKFWCNDSYGNINDIMSTSFTVNYTYENPPCTDCNPRPGPGPGPGPGPSPIKKKCNESWNCGDWGLCMGGKVYRNCIDKNNCNTTILKPEIIKNCTEISNTPEILNDTLINNNDIENPKNSSNIPIDYLSKNFGKYGSFIFWDIIIILVLLILIIIVLILIVIKTKKNTLQKSKSSNKTIYYYANRNR